MDFLSTRSKCIDASGIRRIWQMAASMTDPVNFSIGEPDFAAPEPMKQAAVRAILDDKNTYTVTAGLPQLREVLTAKTTEEFGWPKPTILVTSGLSGALTLALMATLNPGDEVLIADPYFVSYRHLVNFFGGKAVYIDTYPDFRITPERIESCITEKTKLMLLNSPSNPTGVVYTADELKATAAVLKTHNILVFSDEIYKEFSYDGPSASMASYYDNTIVMRGFSKTYGVPGWRLGYVAAPEHLSDVVEQMTTLQQYTFVCGGHPFQVAAVNAFECDISEHIDAYTHKRDLIYNGLKEHFEMVRPEGAFYAFVPAPGGDAISFVAESIKNDVLVIPGNVFSQRDSHFRISYATSDLNIKKGVERLCRLAEKQK